MRIPGTAADFCEDNGDILLIVGEIGKRSRKRMEIVFPRVNSADESFHMSVDLERDVIQRWAVFNNITEGVFGEPFEGTVIDREEPFMLRYYGLYNDLHYNPYHQSIRIECDPDGWTLKVNNEITYETVYHFEDFPKEEIEFVEIFGGGTISYTGFGDKGKYHI